MNTSLLSFYERIREVRSAPRDRLEPAPAVRSRARRSAPRELRSARPIGIGIGFAAVAGAHPRAGARRRVPTPTYHSGIFGRALGFAFRMAVLGALYPAVQAARGSRRWWRCNMSSDAPRSAGSQLDRRRRSRTPAVAASCSTTCRSPSTTASSSCSRVRRAAASRRRCTSSPRSTDRLRDGSGARSRPRAIVTASIATGARKSASSSSCTTCCRTSTRAERRDRDARRQAAPVASATPSARELLAEVGLDEAGPRVPAGALRAVSASASPSRGRSRTTRRRLADEPTGSLDDDTAATASSACSATHCDDGGAVLAVSHDPAPHDAADRVSCLVGGRIEPERVPSA